MRKWFTNVYTTQACAAGETKEDRERGSSHLSGVHGGGDRRQDPRGKGLLHSVPSTRSVTGLDELAVSGEKELFGPSQRQCVSVQTGESRF